MAQRSSTKGFYEAKFKTNKIMGWGTGFKSDIYISRVDVKNAEQANEMRNECQEVIEDYAKTLIGLAMATPVRVGEESITDLVNSIKFEVSECVESIIEQAVKNYQLQLYVDSTSEQHEGVLRGEL